MPRRRYSVTLSETACEVDYDDAVRRLAQALPILAEIARRVEAADKPDCSPVLMSDSVEIKPLPVIEREDR